MNDANGFAFSLLNDLTESGKIEGSYHGVSFSLLMDPLIVIDGDKAVVYGESKQTLKIEEGDGFTVKGPVTIKRNFTANGYSTVMFLFSMKASSISGATFYELLNVVMVEGEWVVSVSEVKDTQTEVGIVKANTPYLVKTANASELVLDEGGYTFVPTEGTLHSVESNGWNLVGTYEYKKWDEGDDGIGKTYGFAGAKGNPSAQIGKFGKISAGAYIYPMRMYLEKNAASGVRFANGAKAKPNVAQDAVALQPESIDVVVDGVDKGTTVIGTLNSRTGEFKAANDRHFDVMGRSVGKKPAAKGSYYNKRKAVAK